MWTRRNERRTRSATFSCIAALTAAALLATAAPVAPRAAAAVAPSAAVADSVRLAPRAESPPPPSVDSAGKSLASADGQHPEWLDRSVAPSTDFFRFANGGWLKSHPIPPDRSYWGVDTILEQENQSFIRGLVESLGKDDWPEGSVERKVADFYASGMDERGIDAAGIAPLQPEFARIALISNPAELLEEIAHLQSIGVEAPLQIGQMQDFKDSTQVIAVASQSGLGLPNRDYYLKSAPTFAAARAAYVLHVTRMFALLGDAPADAERESKAVMGFETRLAKASMPDVEQRNPSAIYHPVTLEGAQTLTPHLNWRQLLSSLGHPEIVSLNVGMPKFFQAVDRELKRTPLADWKTYLRWQLIDGYAQYLSKPFVDEDFRMTAVLTGAQELQARWLRVLRAEDEALGFAIGQLYVVQKFPPAAKEAAAAMVSNIRDALRTDLKTLAWMTPSSRDAAIQKLELMQLRIGYPDRWRDYAGLEIDRGPYVLNVLRANEFEQKRELAKIGKPVDRSEWYMTPQTVNAYYDPSMNSLNVPAGILQPPYFDVSWPDAVNYGATGATIGHEMTHGFDDEGAKFDGHGNLKDWWAPADLTKFREATRCIAEQYSRFTVSGGLHVQGELVTGEATADLGGLMLAWRALHALRSGEASPGNQAFTPDQQFFLAFAQSWAGALRPEQAQEMVTTDPHPPAQYRTNATLSNSPEFQAAFGIPDSSPMVRKDRCVIW
ncbi:MAG: M13 family metallopeptidase [Steroidobacteraceae bacterium]